jgi:isopenicillin N synthase-like dioxygenase
MTTPASIAHVPVIALPPIRGAEPSARAQLVEQVRPACEDVGFLIVTGHGIVPDLLD